MQQNFPQPHTHTSCFPIFLYSYSSLPFSSYDLLMQESGRDSRPRPRAASFPRGRKSAFTYILPWLHHHPVHYSSVLPLPPFYSVSPEQRARLQLAMYTDTFEINKIKGKYKHFSFPKKYYYSLWREKGSDFWLQRS